MSALLLMFEISVGIMLDADTLAGNHPQGNTPVTRSETNSTTVATHDEGKDVLLWWTNNQIKMNDIRIEFSMLEIVTILVIINETI